MPDDTVKECKIGTLKYSYNVLSFKKFTSYARITNYSIFASCNEIESYINTKNCNMP